MSLYSALEKHDLDKRSAVVAHFELADLLWRWNPLKAVPGAISKVLK